MVDSVYMTHILVSRNALKETKMGSVEFTIYLIMALYGLFALAIWYDDEAIHDADKADVHHMHVHS
jgi:hypothetical protein